jgi:KaiC/GvpD/RAD55 family RecA-like ATPase
MAAEDVHLFKTEDEDSVIMLYLSDPRDVRTSNTKIIQEAENAGYSTVVITTNFPASILEKLYMKNNLNLENIYFLDAITIYSLGSKGINDEHHLMIKNPADLTSLGIAVTEILKRTDGKKTFILFDSVSTMLIYLPSIKITRFIHYLANKLRQTNKSGAFLAVDGGLDPMLLTQISTFVDYVIDGE